MIEKEILDKAQQWLDPIYDEDTRNQVQSLIDNDPEQLKESFYKSLEFGTGGLRGVMGVGPNRMNRYSIGLATQGFANYLKKNLEAGEHSVAIAYDCRNNSQLFAQETARVFLGNGFKVYLFKELRPTPLLSYAVRKLGCSAGVVITASHNPPKYNGYKVYWSDGAQVIDPHDQGIIQEVQALNGPQDVILSDADDWTLLGKEMDEQFLQEVEANAIEKEVIRKHGGDLGIVYTSLHGTGATLIPAALERLGFSKVEVVAAQHEPDGNFSTVESPNPEEKPALDMAIDQAKASGAALVLGTDPDTDRVGIAVRTPKGEFELFNGNDTGVLLTWYQLSRKKERGELPSNAYIAKTIVTTPLLDRIAKHFGVPSYDTLTGFKYIAGVIRDREANEQFITGGEESYGYMIGDFVRDKDGVSAATMICEMAVWAHAQGMTLLELRERIHKEFGLFRESLISLKKEGISGAEEIKQRMENYRSATPSSLAGAKVLEVRDFRSSEIRYLEEGRTETIDLPSSNVMQFLLEDGALVTARPSGTEPKIKYYFSVHANEFADYAEERKKLDKRLNQLADAFLD